MARAQAEMARSMLTDTQKKQLAMQLKQAEKALVQMAKSNPGLYQQQLVGFINAACYLGDAAMAERMFSKVTDPTYREAVVTGCKQMGVALGAAKKM